MNLNRMWNKRMIIRLSRIRRVSSSRRSQSTHSPAITDVTKAVTNKAILMNNKFISEPTTSFISEVELKNILRSHNCKFEDGYTCLRVDCISNRKNTESNIYVNKTTGLFMCMDCQETGDWNSFKNRIVIDSSKGNAKNDARQPKTVKGKTDSIEDCSGIWNDLKTTCQMLTSFSSAEQENIFSYFHLPVLVDKKLLNNLNVLYDSTGKVLYFPLTNGSKRIVGIMEYDINGNEKCYPLKKCAGVLKIIPNRVPRKCEQVVLVHKIRYLIALANHKHNYHVICLPHGTSALPQEILPLLEQYSKVVLWFGSDKLELTAAKLFAKKLREERCFLVRDPKGSVPSQEKQNVLKLISSAQSMVPENIITFSDLKDEIYAGLINSDQNEGTKWNRFPGLNEILRGHRRGELTILTGPTGSGKTTFLCEYSLDLAVQGITTLWGSFEIRNQRLMRTILQQFCQEPLVENIQNFEKWSQEFEKLPLYFLKFHGQQPLKNVMKVVEHAAYVHDIQHLIIDNVQFMLGLSAYDEGTVDRFLKQDLVIAAFRTFATYFDCHVTLVIHPRKENDGDDLMMSSIFGGAKATQEADNVLIIQKKITESLQVKKYLQVVKNRFSGDLGVMPLSFNKSTLSFSSKHLKRETS